jgi:hypothetical protein
MAQYHDIYRQGAPQNVAYNAAGGASVQSTTFGPQTHWIRVTAPGVLSATSGLRIKVGDNPTADATSTLLPVNWVEYIHVTPGQKIAVISNDTVTGNLSVTELE